MILSIFLLTILVGGIGGPLIKFTLNYLPTITFVASRALLSTLVLLPFVFRHITKINTKEIKFLILANLLFSANWLFFAFGIQKTSVIMGQLIYLPTALIVAVIAFVFLKEKLTKSQIIGLLITSAGLVILAYGSFKSQDILSFGTPVGNLLVIGGLISWSLYTVVSRKISNIYKPQVVTFFNFAITSLITLFIFPFNLKAETIQILQIPLVSIIALVGVVVLSSTLFFFLHQWLVKNTSAFVSSLVLYPSGLIATLAGVVFFDEKLTAGFIFGSMLVLVGVFIATTFSYIKKKYAT